MKYGNKNVKQVRFGSKLIQKIYCGTKLAWEAVKNCFSSGIWKGELPWSGKDAWKG